MKNIIAIITARKGSKRIPHKNIVDFGGQPLISWTIKAALNSKMVNRVIVSTDDPEILKISREYGVDAPFVRPKKLSADNSSHSKVVAHCLDWVLENEKYRPDLVVLLQPTSPLRSSNDIDEAVKIMIEKDADSVISVFELHLHPYFAKRILPDGRIINFMERPDGYISKQTIPPVYYPNGAVYVFKQNFFLNNETVVTNNSYPYIMPVSRSIDIDDPWDLYLARLIVEDKFERNNRYTG